jgi:GNAT superfamily N-acetyltransferase
MAAVVALEPASRRAHAELAEIFNAGYEGYYTSFTLEEAAFRFMSELWDDDLAASRVALVDGEPAGICKLAIRGDRGWIAGVGVALPHRGKGLGERLMRAAIEESRARGLRELWLEVLVRADETVAKSTGVEGIASEDGALLFRRSGDRVSLLQAVASNQAAAERLLRSLPPETTGLQWLNGPEGDVFNLAIAALGGTLAHRQHEMLLEL